MATTPPTATTDPKTDPDTKIATTEQTLPAARPPDRVPVRMGVSPATLDEAWRLAQIFSQSELVPKGFRGKPADVLVAMELGMELGFAPLQALQSIAVINGRPSVWGDGLMALIVASPLYDGHDEYFEVDNQRRDGLTVEDLKKDTTAAVCIFRRHNKAEPITCRFTIGQAKKAGLLTKEGPWLTYPDRMLKMRARGFAARDGFADLLRGIKTAEEVYDVPDDDVEDQRPAPTVVRRISQTPDLHSFTDRTAATRAATRTPITVGPAAVVDVQPFLGGFIVHLADGILLDTFSATDAADLEKIKGSPKRFTFTCEPGDLDGAHPQISSFAIVD